VLGLKEERAPKKELEEYVKGGRPVGRPRGRWIDAVDKDDERMLKCKNWRRSAEDRDDWKRRNEEAKCHR
jgi:hypothetical protein